MRETHVAQTFFFCQAICLLLGYSWLCEALLYDHIFFSLKKKKKCGPRDREKVNLAVSDSFREMRGFQTKPQEKKTSREVKTINFQSL